MDIGKTNDNYIYYEGFEDEPEIILSAENTNMQVLHIWDGYLDDILRNPKLDGKGWSGFTRDYHQLEGAFGDNNEMLITEIDEYLNDLKSYANRHFDYDDTKAVYDLLCSWLETAICNKCVGILIKVV